MVLKRFYSVLAGLEINRLSWYLSWPHLIKGWRLVCITPNYFFAFLTIINNVKLWCSYFFIMLIQCHFPLVFEVSDKTLCRAVFVCTTPAKKSKSALKASSPVEAHKNLYLGIMHRVSQHSLKFSRRPCLCFPPVWK